MPARTFPNLGLQGGFDPGENGWDDEMTLNLLKLSALTQAAVIDKVAATPGSPAAGDVYLFSAAHPTNANDIAIFDGPTGEETWTYVTPDEGWLVFNKAADYYEKFDGTVWAELETGGGGSGGGIEDAPADGSVYARRDNEWAEIISPDGQVPEGFGLHRYWRIYIAANNGETTFSAATGIQLRGPAGTNLIGSGTPIASSFPSAATAPQYAFTAWTSDSENYWSTASGSAYPSWIGYDFGTPVDIRSFTMTGVRAANRMPQIMVLQYSDDGVAWQSAQVFRPAVNWVLGGVDTRQFFVTDVHTPVRSWDVGFPFKGCRAERTANIAVTSTVSAIPWTSEVYDYGGWHDNATNNTRFTVPEGVKRVRITGQFCYQSPSGGQSFSVRKNGNTSVQFATAQVGNSAYSFSVQHFDTGTIEVSPGDYFEVYSEGSSTLVPSRTFFQIEAVSDKVSRADLSPTLNAQAASYSLVAADDGNIVEMTSASANTATIPADATTGIAVGSTFSVVQIGAGVTTIQAAAGVTLNGIAEGSADISGQWGGVSLYKRGPDQWVIQGAHGGVS